MSNASDYPMGPFPEASGPFNPEAVIVAVVLFALLISFILILNYWEPIKEIFS